MEVRRSMIGKIEDRRYRLRKDLELHRLLLA
jgi:hypothetical protein